MRMWSLTRYDEVIHCHPWQARIFCTTIIPPTNCISNLNRVRIKVAIKLVTKLCGLRCSKNSHVIKHVVACWCARHHLYAHKIEGVSCDIRRQMICTSLSAGTRGMTVWVVKFGSYELPGIVNPAVLPLCFFEIHELVTRMKDYLRELTVIKHKDTQKVEAYPLQFNRLWKDLSSQSSSSMFSYLHSMPCEWKLNTSWRGHL